MFEVKSKTDTLAKLRQKIQEFLELGTQVGVLVDPRNRTMEVYPPEAQLRSRSSRSLLPHISQWLDSSYGTDLRDLPRRSPIDRA